MASNDVAFIIKTFLCAAKAGKNKYDKVITSTDESGNKSTIFNCKYLLNQIIRNYKIPKENHHVSEKALHLWNQITTQDIRNFYYDETIVCDNIEEGGSVTAMKYKGNESIGDEIQIKKYDKIKFNDIFTGEHMIPVKVVIEELLLLDNPSDEEIIDTLNHIHICRVTKEEDKKINKVAKSNRPFDYDTVVSTVYKKAGVKII